MHVLRPTYWGWAPSLFIVFSYFYKIVIKCYKTARCYYGVCSSPKFVSLKPKNNSFLNVIDFLFTEENLRDCARRNLRNGMLAKNQQKRAGSLQVTCYFSQLYTAWFMQLPNYMQSPQQVYSTLPPPPPSSPFLFLYISWLSPFQILAFF